MVRWSFGVGEQGVKEPVREVRGVMVVDESFPCWLSAAKSVGLTVSGIWLTSTNVSSLKFIIPSAGEIVIDTGPKIPVQVWDRVDGCKWLLIGGRFPEVLRSKRLWTNRSLVGIIVSSGLNFCPPKPWTATTHVLKHAEVGGVTDGVYKFTSILRKGIPRKIRYDETPRQDLRTVLKTGGEGQRTMNLSLPPGRSAAKSVVYCGPGIIEEASLLPVEFPNILVKTRWRNFYHIQRKLESMEQLLALDVSEKLIKSIPDGPDRYTLIESVHTPGKVLVRVLEHICRVTEGGDRTRKRKAAELDEGKMLKKDDSGERTLRWPDWLGTEDNSPVDGVKRLIGLEAPFISRLAGQASVETVEQVREAHNDKATKHDGAVAQVDLWNQYLRQGLSQTVQARDIGPASEVLRRWMLQRWKRNIVQSYVKWVKDTGDNRFHAEAWDCISRAFRATWWAWNDGSRPAFWRWPSDYMDQVRDGSPVRFQGPVIPWTLRQRLVPDADRVNMIRGKLKTIQDKRYVEEGPIHSLMSYFDVPKGADDIRMVYDGSASGLNENLWAPWFSLPTIDNLVRALEPGYSMADNDVGEMFHNFVLHKDLRRLCGMDFTPYFKKCDGRGRQQKNWMRWNRLAMGLRTSPYCAIQAMMILKECILGLQYDERNVFRWESVRLNLPGSATYDPSLAWVTKVRKNGEVAADAFIYVDDVRCSAPTQMEAWQAAQRVSTILAHKNVQDATRKRRYPSQTAGAWTGSVAWTSNGRVVVKTSQEKWDKTKEQLKWIVENIDNWEGMDYKMLLSIRGFLVYVSRTYTSMVPYLKGLHSTIDSWRAGRNSRGFKITKAIQRRYEAHEDDDEYLDWDEERLGMTPISDVAPKLVFPVDRFRDDIKCLLYLTLSDTPPDRQVRMLQHAKVVYGFGDASKSGFGASIELPDKSIVWRFGQWTLEQEQEEAHPGLSFIKERSSNYRELRNLVEALEGAHTEGLLSDREVFMFTDNSTAESAYFKGISTSEDLFELVLRLRKLEMTGDCIIHMVHVAGTRMIDQGTDGLSRGDRNSGIMAGESMLSFIPLHLSAFDRAPDLEDWVRMVFEIEGECGEGFQILTHNQWPQNHTIRGMYVWAPPPAAADVAAEYMVHAIHKRPHSTHIFICPRLMTHRWQRLVRKSSALYLFVPVKSVIWDSSQHEPLILAISLPLSRDKPWKHAGSPSAEHYGKILPDLFRDDPDRAVIVLRECVVRAWRLAQL